MITKTTRRTRYQSTHRPLRTVEVMCTSRKPLKTFDDGEPDGLCPDCDRWLKRGGRDHKPNRTGSLGWIEHYADGSTRYIKGES